MVYGLAGKKEEATTVVNELLALDERQYVTPAALVFAYTGLGDKDQAFLWMEKCSQERSNFMVFLKLIPLFDPLRSDPRFEEMLRRIYPPNDVSALAPPDEKSIASAGRKSERRQEHRLLSAGIQDHILTTRWRGDLKVISRSQPQNIKQAGELIRRARIGVSAGCKERPKGRNGCGEVQLSMPGRIPTSGRRATTAS